MPINRKLSNPEPPPINRAIAARFPLRPWYSSTDLKTYLGPVANKIFMSHKTITALGDKEKPSVELIRYDDGGEWRSAVPITVEEAREAWSDVTAATVFLGVPFIISRRGEYVAVMHRHPDNRHGAFRFAQRYHDLAGPQENTTLLQALEAQTAAFRDMSAQLVKIGESQEVLHRIAIRVWPPEEGRDPGVVLSRPQAH
jgi:hypothetical protein